MKEMLAASRIIENIESLLGLTTKRQVAEFFGVGPSAVCDWVRRKGDKIPSSRLAGAAARHNLRWQWLAYGEGNPYEETAAATPAGTQLGRDEILLLQKLKESPAFKRAVRTLLGLDEKELRLLGAVAGSMSRSPCAPEGEEGGEEEPWLEWRSGFPLTNLR